MEDTNRTLSVVMLISSAYFVTSSEIILDSIVVHRWDLQRLAVLNRQVKILNAAGATNDNFQKIICSEDDLRSRIF